ncbi:alpha/beta hydrolase family protein [Dokdonella fugitiva]|uniref:S9 family peptidase n=1 Tax=Dokdonella fugitiva TaxID=328517 RepID=UPI0015FA465D|nr:S9 family peptidase [Dokdonella fugitiva]MBA8884165.1 dipeptidyl aminopeptidase/acylaminoacyl peptidase [Dokdonella fugitiva]
MKPVLAAAIAAAVALPAAASAASHPFDVHDLVMMDRVSDPALSPDGTRVAFSVRETDYEANKGRNGIWTVPYAGGAPQRLTDKALNASSARWSSDGKALYFLAPKDGTSQLWRIDANGGAATQATSLPLDVNNFRLSPDGKRVLLSLDVFNDCADDADVVACTQKKLDARKADKASGTVYDSIFVRHWDTWADGRRSQLFVADLGADGKPGKLELLTRGIDGDVPSKPFGDDSEYMFSPDGKTVYFNARIAGKSEPWSTNFDIFSVAVEGAHAPKNLTADNPAWDGYPLPSADGRTLYWLAMKRAGFEADRFGIWALDLASGAKREIDPQWDRSASGLRESADGKTLYTATDDWGDHALFAVDVASGKASKLVADGSIAGFDLGAKGLVLARNDFKRPNDLYTARADGKNLRQITRFNADRLKDIRFGDTEFFTFKGYGGDTVQGYVTKPVDYRKGEKYPVAFIVHGGPQGAMTNDFHYRWNPQTYAGQGFAVVTINFHGSTGYGQAFTDRISGDWGGAPLDDLKAGWAAAQQKYAFLDGNRACALGASYGGYMMYWMAGVWNEPWKCIVSHDGVFDSRMMSYSTEELWFDEWEHAGKTQYEDPAGYEKYNPVNHVKDWRVPMLVVHSDQDFRIPLEQGLAAFTALQRRGIPSEFLRFPDENHWVLKPHNSVLWHDTVNAWLKRWTAQDAQQ